MNQDGSFTAEFITTLETLKNDPDGDCPSGIKESAALLLAFMEWYEGDIRGEEDYLREIDRAHAAMIHIVGDCHTYMDENAPTATEPDEIIEVVD